MIHTENQEPDEIEAAFIGLDVATKSLRLGLSVVFFAVFAILSIWAFFTLTKEDKPLRSLDKHKAIETPAPVAVHGPKAVLRYWVRLRFVPTTVRIKNVALNSFTLDLPVDSLFYAGAGLHQKYGRMVIIEKWITAQHLGG